MEIRRIKANEWEVFKSLRLTALQQDGNQFGQSYEQVKDYSDDRWKEETKKAAESADFFLVLAFEVDKPIGITGCVRTPDFGKIFTVWVGPAYRGKGIGRLLISTIMAIARCELYKLMVVQDNLPAIKTYENLGFTSSGFTYVNHKGFKEIEMILKPNNRINRPKIS
jgi:ribosomal protein S18 acetylase RimI-like enzyme